MLIGLFAKKFRSKVGSILDDSGVPVVGWRVGITVLTSSKKMLPDIFGWVRVPASNTGFPVSVLTVACAKVF
jgi:hypothetical protein